MSRTAYILKADQGLPYSPNGAVAARGFEHLGYEVRYFTRGELPTLPLNSQTPVVAGVGTVMAALEQMGVRVPSHMTAPSCLEPFLGRKCWRSTLGEIRRGNAFPVFIKPYEDTKRFTGFVARGAADIEAIPRLEGESALDDDYEVLAQEAVCFLSEWRVFVIHGKAAGTTLHSGDPLLFPKGQIIRQTLGAYSMPPDGYSADFGVTDDGRTLLIEINEGYSLGSGHLKANQYASLLKARWEQMTAQAGE